ncbi:MAG: putative tricarboxylic transport rane protein [Clostridia bacterium]|nr:putative tricarboxylic transport rane protein [Clostridia bacterium]
MLENMLMGFDVIFSWQNLLLIVLGVSIGILVGATPGLSGSTGVALLLPFTFGLPVTSSLVVLCALYTAAEYGGSITAIAINTPGTPAAVATAFDGYPLFQQGKGGKALGVSIVASTYGGLFSTLVLIFASVPLANFALRFGPPEYFALGVFGLTIIASLSSENWVKGFVAAVLGLLLKTVGVDPFSGYPRFIFGKFELMNGFHIVPVLLGLFAVSEVFRMLEEEIGERKLMDKTFGRILPTIKEYIGLIPTILRSGVIGVVIGVMPGAGATIASLISYDQAKKMSKNPEKFGKGALEGVAASEAANNASVGGALIPLLALGVPGSATTAILVGALMMKNITPGPELFSKMPEVVYGLFASLLLANIVMLIVGLGATNIWVRVNRIPKTVLCAAILAISFVGSYAIGNSLFDVWVLLGFGVLGYVFKRYGFPVAPIVLAMVLGFMVESSFRRALLTSGGDYRIFFHSGISVALLIMAVISFCLPFISEYRRRKKARTMANIDIER